MESSRRRFIKPVVAGLALAGVLSGIALVPMLNGSAQADEADGAPARASGSSNRERPSRTRRPTSSASRFPRF